MKRESYESIMKGQKDKIDTLTVDLESEKTKTAKLETDNANLETRLTKTETDIDDIKNNPK